MATDLSKIVELVIKVKDEASAVLKKASRELKEFDTNLDKSGKSAKAVGVSSKTASTGVKTLDTSVKKLNTDLKKTTTESKKSSKNIKDLGKDSKKSAGSIKGLGTAVRGVATAFAGLVAASAAVSLPVIEAASFNRSMAEVKAITGEVSEVTFKRMNDVAREMGATTEFSAQQAAGGLKFLAMAGLEAEESIAALPGVLNLAQAGNMELARAADIATNVLTGMNLEVSELGRVNDVLTQTFTSTNSSLEELGTSMSYVAPVAAGFGLEIEATSAALGLLHNAGIKGSMAGTTLRGILTRLVSPTKEAAEVMATLGKRIGQSTIEITDSQGKFLGFENVLGQFERAGITAEEAMRMLGQRAGPGMVALLSQGSKAFTDLNNKLKDSAGRAQEVADIMHDNLMGDMKALISVISELMISIGQKLIPVFRLLVQVITNVVGVVAEFINDYPILSGAIIGLTAAVLGLVAAMALLKIGGMITGFSGISIAATKAASGISFIITAMGALGTASITLSSILSATLGWVSVIATAVAGLVAGGMKIYNIFSGFDEAQAEIEGVANEARKMQLALEEAFEKDYNINIVDFKTQTREELIELPKVDLDTYIQQFTRVKLYTEERIKELQAIAKEETFWTGAQTEEAKQAVEELAEVEFAYVGLQNARDELVLAMSGPTAEDIGKKLSKGAIEAQAAYSESLGVVGAEYATLEKEASRSYKDIQKHADSSLKEQTAAIGAWAGTYDKEFDDLAHKSMTTMGGLQDALKKALTIDDTSAIISVGASLTAAAKAGAGAFQAMGDNIRSVLDEVAAKEKALLSDIEGFADKIAGIYASAGEARKSIEREGMSDSQKYYDSKKSAEQELTRAAELRSEADKATGEAKNKLLEKSNEHYKNAKSYVNDLKASEENGITTAKSKADRLKIIAEFEKGSVSNLKVMKSAAEADLAVWEAKAIEVTKMKTMIDGMAETLNKTLTLDLSTGKALEDLAKIQDDLSRYTGDGLLFEMNTTGVDSIKEDVRQIDETIVKVGDTWKNVWTDVEKDSKKAANTIRRDFSDLENVKVNVEFTGSGSATLPISEKVKAIQSELTGLGEDVNPTVDTDMSSASEGIVDLEDTFNNMNMSIQEAETLLNDLRFSMMAIGAEDSVIITVVVQEAGDGLTSLLDLLQSSTQEPISIKVAVEVTKMADLEKLISILQTLVTYQDMDIGVAVSIGDTADIEDPLKDISALSDEYGIIITIDVPISDQEKITSLETSLLGLENKFVTITADVLGKKDVDALKGAIDDLQDKTITITTVQKTVESRASGGMAGVQGFATGGSAFQRLISPFIAHGSGNKDDVPAMLWKGEYVQTVDAVRTYGRDFMDAVRNRTFPIASAMQGMAQNFAVGGPVFSMTNPLPSAGNISSGVQQTTTQTPVSVDFNLPVEGPPVETTMTNIQVEELFRQMEFMRSRQS